MPTHPVRGKLAVDHEHDAATRHLVVAHLHVADHHFGVVSCVAFAGSFGSYVFRCCGIDFVAALWCYGYGGRKKRARIDRGGGGRSGWSLGSGLVRIRVGLGLGLERRVGGDRMERWA